MEGKIRATVVNASKDGIGILMTHTLKNHIRMRIEIALEQFHAVSLVVVPQWSQGKVIGCKIVKSHPLWAEYISYVEGGLEKVA